jgi:hypothetical protein
MAEVPGERSEVRAKESKFVGGRVVPHRLDLPVPSPDDKVIRGKDDWLFLGNDSNDTLGQHAGERLLTDLQVRQWHDLLEARSAWLSLLGIPYTFLIAPDPHAIYADKLPDEAVPGATRPALQVLDRLAERDSWAPVLYPLSALQADRDDVYAKTDSHWSEWGAYLAYRELMAKLTEAVPVRRLKRQELHLTHEQRAGDLGLKFEPPIMSRFVYVDVIGSRVHLVHDNRVRNHGRLVEFKADVPNALTCLVFGDSYATRMMPLIAESFQRTLWAHIYFDYELVRELQPDVVVTVKSERGMIVVQSDTGPGIRMLEEQKRADGDMLRPRDWESLRINGTRPSLAPERPPAVTDGASRDA